MKYYSAEAIMVTEYFQFPKWLKDMKISSDAKLLYVYLFDRYRLSLQNGWIDDQNRVYLICSRGEMQKLLDCSKSTAIKASKALAEVGLIDEEPVVGGTNRIYLLAPSYSEVFSGGSDTSTDSKNPETSNEVGGYKNYTGGRLNSRRGVVQNLDPNKNDTSNNKKSKNYYSNDDVIEETLNLVEESHLDDSVVVNNNSESSFLSSKEIREKVKGIMKANIEDNDSYNCFEDPTFSDSLEYDSTRKALLDFAECHEKAKDFPFFRLRDIASCWTRNAEIYRSPEAMVKAEKMLLKVMNSFTKPAEKLAILSMETEDILYLLENLQKYYNSEEESSIVNPQTWTAGTIRPMISANVYAFSGAQI